MKRSISWSAAICCAVVFACAERTKPSYGAPDAVARFQAWLDEWEAALPAERRALEGEGLALARERRALLREWIRTDPERALAAAVPHSRLGELPASVRSLLEERIDAVGRYDVIGVLYEDGVPPGALLVRRLAHLGGRTYEVFTYGRRLSVRSKESLPIHGVALDGEMAMLDSPVRRLEPSERPLKPLRAAPCSAPIALDVGDEVRLVCSEAEAQDLKDALEGYEASPNPSGPQASPWTVGQKKLLYIRVDFSDAPGDPLSDADVDNAMAALNNYIRAASYNKTSITWTRPATLTMPQTKAWYEQNNADTRLLADARTAASNAGYPGNQYDLDIVAFRKMSSWGFAGQGYVGQKGTWLNGSFGLHTTAHEIGHNLGLFHANFWQSQGESIIGPGSSLEYGNPFEIMGGGGGHYNAWYKFDLDWLLPSEVATVSATPGSAERIYDLEAFTTGGLKAIQVPIDPSRSYWIEFRPQGGGALVGGASINWGYATARSSNLLDMVPQTGSANDSPLLIGRTFADVGKAIYITVPLWEG